jgi:hypothetical protein
MRAIQSMGPPPQRHADRVVAEMMRDLARKRASLWDDINEAIATSSDGNPKAQRKMEERVKRAGALKTILTPGKRGCYTLIFYDMTGWDQRRDEEILLGDEIPERPWIACIVNMLESLGRGRETVKRKSSPVVFITHHAMSRTAQRFGLRTSEHLMTATRVIWNGTVSLVNRKGKSWLDAPPQGWRVPIEADGRRRGRGAEKAREARGSGRRHRARQQFSAHNSLISHEVIFLHLRVVNLRIDR